MLNDPKGSFGSNTSRWFFMACFLFMLYLAYLLVQPYLTPIFLAMVLVVVGGPVYDYLLTLFRGRRGLASAAACTLFLLIIVIPAIFITGVITSQALELYNTVTYMVAGDKLQGVVEKGLGSLSPYFDKIEQLTGLKRADLLDHAAELLKYISNLLYLNLTGLVRGATNLAIGFALMMFVTFFLLMDGQVMARRIIQLSPLPAETTEHIRDDILQTLRTTLRGTVVLAIFQGTLGGLGFFVFGVPHALFWGTVMVFASVVPLVGTALLFIPAGVYLILVNHPFQAVGVMVWCGVAQLACDNLLRPRLVGGTNIHPLLTFFSILGGLSVFGMVGLILGPLILAVLISLLEVYENYFQEPMAQEICYPEPAEQPTSGESEV